MLRFFLPTLILLLTVACSENGSKTKKSGGDAGADGGNLDAGTDAGDIIVADLRYLPFATPGTRLEPRMMGFDGAPPIFVSWFDTMLGVECDARFAQDGKLRCLPRGSVAPITVRPASDCTGGSTLLDAQSCGLSGYDALATDLSEGQTTCANRGVGTQITLYASTPWPHGDYSEGSPGECVTTEVVPTGSVELTDPSTKNATDFVEFTTRFETIEPGGLGVMIQEGADGSARLLGGAVTDGVHCS
ncbi:MAG: hypothetical protein KC416_03470, partial [Myxococcales bacterium]|nr:hypothetical protein [Myxococcales bacterium]